MSKTTISPADNLFVDFCDYDRNWGFLLFLRPERHESIGVARALAASVPLGLPIGLLGSILVSLAARLFDKPAPAVLAFPAVLVAVYFVAAHMTLFRAWNRRAERLARLK